MKWNSFLLQLLTRWDGPNLIQELKFSMKLEDPIIGVHTPSNSLWWNDIVTTKICTAMLRAFPTPCITLTIKSYQELSHLAHNYMLWRPSFQVLESKWTFSISSSEHIGPPIYINYWTLIDSLNVLSIYIIQSHYSKCLFGVHSKLQPFTYSNQIRGVRWSKVAT